MNKKLQFWYKFFRLYDNPAGLALTKARNILLGKSVYLNKKHTLKTGE